MYEQLIFETLESLEILRGVKKVEDKKGCLVFEVQTDIENQEICLAIHFDKHFPYSLPIIHLKPFDALGFIPHVDKIGNVCFIQKDNLFLDIENPQNIIIQSIDKALNTLKKGVKCENKEDFYNEFEAYWRELSLNKKKPFLINLDLAQEVAQIKIGICEHEPVLAVNDNNTQCAKRFCNDNLSFQNAIYIRLDTLMLPSPSTYKFTLDDVKNVIFNHISTEKKDLITRLLKGQPKRKEYVILGMTQPNGNTACFGFEIKTNQKTFIHPLLCDSTSNIRPLSMLRIDTDYMVSRGGLDNALKDKKGLLIGCGSVGGYIAEELIKSGILTIDIVDNDNFSIDNVYRHVGGFQFIGYNKAKMMKTILEKKYPHATIGAYDKNILDFLEQSKSDIKFEHLDFIIIATGNPSVNIKLNEFFIKNHHDTPLLFTWIDPYGIGGHCLLTNLKGNIGCYNCLYENEEQDNWGYNKASFAATNQVFQKSISGCGSTYMPYGSIDAAQTALLTVRKVLDILRGQEQSNAIFSFKNDKVLFEKESFNTSTRYEQSTEELESNKGNFSSPTCRVCSTHLR